MPWPTPQDYNEAIQNLAQNCADPGLAAGGVTTTALGLPRPITGNFASVYRVRAAGADWAVRCFWREFADQQERYAAISRHLQRVALPYTVGFDYLPTGIRIRGVWYPLLKMEWVEGELLSIYVQRRLGNPTEILTLAERWREMIQALDDNRIAHGDLQHGNVLVVGGQLKLVDYDGMYVPDLAGRPSHELGHQHYQHPARTGTHFGPWLDHFPAAVIYLSLLALGEQPELWRALDAGEERLLFRRQDFTDPGAEVWRRLGALRDPRVLRLLPALGAAVRASPDRIASLDALLAPPAKSARPSAAVRPAVARLPAWVPDHLPPPPPPPHFSGRRVPLLLVLLTIIALGMLVGALAVMPLLIDAGSVLASAAGVVALAYWNEPAVRAKRVLQGPVRAARWRVYGARAHAVWRQMQGRSIARLSASSESRADRRRGRLQARHRRAREKVEHRHEGRRSSNATALHDLAGARQAEIAGRLETLRGQHILTHLRRQSVRHAPLDGVSFAIRSRLWLSGVRTAADVDAAGLTTARRLSPPAARILAEWRVDAELAGRRGAPSVLPHPELTAISTHFQRREDALLRRGADIERERAADLAAVVRCFTTREQHLAEKTARPSARWAARTRRRDTALAEAHLSLHRALSQSHHVCEELAPYRDITAGRYVHYLLAGGQEDGSKRHSV